MISSNPQLSKVDVIKNLGFSTLLRRLRSLSWLSFLSGIVLVFGFLREIVVARQFGVSQELDVFIAVFGVYMFLGLQVGNTLEMTIISKWERIPDIDDRRKLLSSVIVQLGLMMVVAAAIVLALFGDGFSLLFPDLSVSHAGTAMKIMQGLAIGILFSSMAGLLRGVLNTQRIFMPGIIGGAVISLTSILSMFVWSQSQGIYALVIGIITGNAVLLAWYALLLVKNGILRLSWQGMNLLIVRPFWMAVLIVLIGELLFQVYGMGQRSIASHFETGTISAFYYASSIMLVPLALVVMPLLTTVYPQLAAILSTDRVAGVRLLLKYAALLLVFSTVVATLLALFAKDLIALVFVGGAFSVQAAEKTGEIMSVLCASLPFIAITRLAMYALYSIADYVTPVIGNLVSVVVLLALAWLVVPVYGVIGLAASIVAASGAATLFKLSVLVWRLRCG